MQHPIQVKRSRTHFLRVLLIVQASITGVRPSADAKVEVVDVATVSAVTGGDALLPCNTFSKTKNDVLLLVVWYKNNRPWYSFDTRKNSSLAHWADERLGGRARWLTGHPSRLSIRNITSSDRALYRCRVDFKMSPTKNHKVLLDVIELPEKPKIFDESDTEIVGVTEPYVEDRMDFKLTCIVSGGKPNPRVRWWRDDQVIATLLPADDDTRLSVLDLKIPQLTRDYFEAVYTCSADNTKLVSALTASIQIQMYLRPMYVEFILSEQPMTVGRPVVVACRAVGARPPAIISWWLDDLQLKPSGPQQDMENKNSTTSYLKWTPQMEHNHCRLTCRAMHVFLEDTIIETSMKLLLHYPPTVTLQYGAKIDPKDIDEGDDVYFECHVDSYPTAYKVVWEHNGQLVSHNQRSGVIAGSAHLVLQSVNRHQAGYYRCIASNVEGDASSEPLYLEILYKPECVMKTTTIVGTAINESTKVICEVDGSPPPTSFQWILNNSMGTIKIDSDKYTVDRDGRSVLSYTPTTKGDYGSLLCRATNTAGQQVLPCKYSLVPAVIPEPLINCTSTNLTESSAAIKCRAGYNGGLPTDYCLEVWEVNKLIANVSTAAPSWILRGLAPRTKLKLVFYAFNERGRSDNISINIETLDKATVTGDKRKKRPDINGWTFGIIIALTSIFAVIAIITIVIRKKREAPVIEYEAPLQSVKSYKDESGSVNNSPEHSDDGNPDVVPLEFNGFRNGEHAPDPPPYGGTLSAPVETSRSTQSLINNDLHPSTAHTTTSPNSGLHTSLTVGGSLTDDRRSFSSGAFNRRREIVTTKTPLLGGTRESRV